MKYIVDSDVLIHALNRTRPGAAAFLGREFRATLSISLITWIEVMTGATEQNRDRTRIFLSSFHEIHGLSPEIAERAVDIRRTMKLKLPDAIIYATALVNGSTLVTYNTRDFPPRTPSTQTPKH